MYFTEATCCEAEDCVEECQCESHGECTVCGIPCGCICDDLYESYRDSLLV